MSFVHLGGLIDEKDVVHRIEFDLEEALSEWPARYYYLHARQLGKAQTLREYYEKQAARTEYRYDWRAADGTTRRIRITIPPTMKNNPSTETIESVCGSIKNTMKALGDNAAEAALIMDAVLPRPNQVILTSIVKKRDEVCRAAEALGHAYVVETTQPQEHSPYAPGSYFDNPFNRILYTTAPSWTITIYTDGLPAPTPQSIEAEVSKRVEAQVKERVEAELAERTGAAVEQAKLEWAQRIVKDLPTMMGKLGAELVVAMDRQATEKVTKLLTDNGIRAITPEFSSRRYGTKTTIEFTDGSRVEHIQGITPLVYDRTGRQRNN